MSHDVEMAIEDSRRILELEDDWDGEGAESYHPETLERAIAFVRFHSIAATRLGLRLVPPRILPGPHASIDLLWHSGAFELLLNFPEDPDADVTFYGDDRRGTVVRGTLRAGDAPTINLVPWLIAQ